MKKGKRDHQSLKTPAAIAGSIIVFLLATSGIVFLNSSDSPQTKNPTQSYGDLKDEGQLLWMHPNGGGWKALIKNTPNEWDTTLDNVDGFGVFLSDIKNADQEEVNSAVKFLNERNIRLQVETAGLRPHACTGEKGAAIDVPILEKLKIAGIEQIVLRPDGPFLHTSKSDSPCEMTNEEITEEFITYMKIIQEKYPKVEFVWNEPIGFFDIGPYKSNSQLYNLGDLEIIATNIFTKADKQNINLVGFTVDMSLSPTAYYTRGKGFERLVYLQNAINSQEKRFAILLNFAGIKCPKCINGQTATNEEFYLATLGYYDCFIASGGSLDDIYPESWWNHPTKTLPEEEPHTFTNLMLGFIDRLNDPDYAPTCEFVNDIFLPEQWGQGIDEKTTHTTR